MHPTIVRNLCLIFQNPSNTHSVKRDLLLIGFPPILLESSAMRIEYPTPIMIQHIKRIRTASNKSLCSGTYGHNSYSNHEHDWSLKFNRCSDTEVLDILESDKLDNNHQKIRRRNSPKIKQTLNQIDLYPCFFIILKMNDYFKNKHTSKYF